MNLRREGVIRKDGRYTEVTITITSSLRQGFSKDPDFHYEGNNRVIKSDGPLDESSVK